MVLRSIAQSLPNPVTVAIEKQYSTSLIHRSVLPRRIRSPFFGLVVLGAIALLFRLRHSSDLSQDRLPVSVDQNNNLPLGHNDLPVSHSDVFPSHNDLPLGYGTPVTHDYNDLPLTYNVPLSHADLPNDTSVGQNDTSVGQNDTSVSQTDLPVSSQVLPNPEEEDTHTPRFYEWHDREKQLPQNDPDLPYPQGREGRYIRFSNQVWGLGWGNAMEEMLLNAHLAYLANRTYVFENYTWDKRVSGDFSSFNGKKIPARVPLTALLSGPVAGDPFPPSADATPAVVPEFFDEVCLNRTIIHSQEINGPLWNASAATILQAWVEKLEQTEDRCVEINGYSGQIFDLTIFGTSKRLLDIWPSFITSPILTHFSWSPLITSALALNAHLIHPALYSATPSDFTPSSHPTPLSGLLALHIRRGDYLEHCNVIANWSASFMGFNEFPELPDRFSPPAVPNWGSAPPEELARYRAHCSPEIEQIVARVREVRVSILPTTRLTRLYVLTNGRADWVQELRFALQEDARREGLDEWERIGTSRDLRLTVEQRHNSHAVDMAVAQRAEVFIGTGFSSMTSNPVMLRAAQGFDWNKTRFW
ncbi:hypothetical protein BJV78DRAFT_229049 [Lactifluus subvellereus]|nr:hypothetical protein BJV78DRAFT_229049 [Lactifluus subvellereus]